MKSFKEYLTESKQNYEFKVKIAGDCPKDCAMLIKRGLSKFNVESCSSGRSTPIQETQADFPSMQNVGCTLFDVTTTYPATSTEVAALIRRTLRYQFSLCQSTQFKKNKEEYELNHANDELSGEALLEKPELEEVSGQDQVGNKRVMSLLKDLNKHKKELEQYKGVNEKILAKKSPTGKQESVKPAAASKSPVGSRKVTLPTAKTAGGL